MAVEEPLLGEDGAADDGADARLHVLVRDLRPSCDRERGPHLKSEIGIHSSLLVGLMFVREEYLDSCNTETTFSLYFVFRLQLYSRIHRFSDPLHLHFLRRPHFSLISIF